MGEGHSVEPADNVGRESAPLSALWRRELRPRGQQTRDKKKNCTPAHQCGAGVRPSLEGLPY